MLHEKNLMTLRCRVIKLEYGCTKILARMLEEEYKNSAVQKMLLSSPNSD